MEQNLDCITESAEETEDTLESEISGTVGEGHPRQRLLYEQRYEEERARLMLELQQLSQGTHWKYLKIVDGLQHNLQERLLLNEIERDNALTAIDREFTNEIAAAELEFEVKKAEFIAKTIADLENEKKTVMHEIATMDINGCAGERSPSMRRKRANEASSSQRKKINYQLKDEEIANDLKEIFADAANVQHDESGDGE